jgi:2-succinyl-5-enolpyruvyl-6-hydroxy-3-cyclohexene-1-carboxylate synthase
VTAANATRQALGVTVGAFVDELVRCGVRQVCLCPGSRSTPLALAMARHPDIRLWLHLDERSAAYFGLGLARASRQPVALVCTSGTAAANFLPAVVEAYYSRIPLLVLTADRPHELRDNGAPQAIDQLQLYGTHVKWFFDLAEPSLDVGLVRHVRTIACRAVATARGGPPGPVHLNCPYREPLTPEPLAADTDWDAFAGRSDGRPYVAISCGPRAPDTDRVAELAELLASARRGLIVCGPQVDRGLAEPLLELAHALDYPVLADPLSGVRCGPHELSLVLDCYDAFLRDREIVERLQPEVVLRFGAIPTSAPVSLFLRHHAGCRQILIDDADAWNEPSSLASDVVQADPRLFCVALRDQLQSVLRQAQDERDGSASDWTRTWQLVDRQARVTITEQLAEQDELFEGKVFAELAALLPDGATLYAGNSMPIRDLDTFFPASERRLDLLANRGTNGIDGVVSSALGASAADHGPLGLAIGDISFYHDSNGLLAARQYGLDVTIVLLNNDGGGIFSFLPQSSELAAEEFELLFGTPHGLDFRPLAETYGATFSRVASWDEFRTAVARGLREGGLHVVEVPTERSRNVTLHRELWPRVAAAWRAAALPARERV